jgi:hypothetical protein
VSWFDEHERSRNSLLCLSSANGPALLRCVEVSPCPDEPERFVVTLDGSRSCAVLARLKRDDLHDAGRNTCPHYDASGRLDGICVAGIEKFSAPWTEMGHTGASRIDWIQFDAPAPKPLVVAPGGSPTVGLEILPSDRNRGRFAGDFVAVGRAELYGIRIHVLTTDGTSTVLDIRNSGTRELLPASMCWIPDVDGDDVPDLAVGCPRTMSGSIVIVGSKADTPDRVLVPEFIAEDGSAGSGDIGWHFGTRVRAIPDQDRDGKDDLLVAATSMGGFSMSPAALSVVSTKSWKVIRIVYERDLVKSNSRK